MSSDCSPIFRNVSSLARKERAARANYRPVHSINVVTLADVSCLPSAR